MCKKSYTPLALFTERKMMKEAFLETTQDLKWLQEVHKIPTALEYRFAILYGNEDAPTMVQLFAKNHYQCQPTVYSSNTEGNLVLVTHGELPNPKFIEDRPESDDDVIEDETNYGEQDDQRNSD